ncbi:MAG: hydrogenase maturation protease [Candidatus Bipolaricaulota bacterium]|nr:MAG: hydrogenase maturation protease [Candidatus Bipolaricaulota bacterium]
MIAVVGVGNELMRDDGVGVHALRRLSLTELPANVELIDGGTSPEAAFLVRDHRRIIVIDAARGGGVPGTVYRFAPEEIARGSGCASCHDAGIVTELRSLAAEDPPEIVIVGVEPADVSWGLELSPEVEHAMDDVVAAVRHEIESGGEDARHRAETG